MSRKIGRLYYQELEFHLREQISQLPDIIIRPTYVESNLVHVIIKVNV